MNKGPSNLPNDPFGGWEAERRHFIRAGDGTRILVRDDGPLSSSEGGHVRTPILCLPGLSRTGTDFQKLVDRYGRQVRILRPDMRGRGGSAWAKDPLTYRPETYLDDIRHVLAALGVHKVRVVGTSLGGLLAMGMSISQPTVLEAALLNDIGPYIPTTGTQNIAAYLDATTPQKDWASAIAHLKGMLPDLGLPDEDAWERFTRGTYREDPAKTAQGVADALEAHWDPAIVTPLRKPLDLPDLWPLFRGLGTRPAVAVRGGQSNILPADCLERMQREKPDLIALTVPQAGHTPSLSEDMVLPVVDRFILGS